MSDYTITTDFGAKDSLPSGNAAKIIKGSEFTTEFTNIKTAVNTKADTTGDTFTGAVTFDAAVTINSTATITGDLTVDTNTLFVDVSEDKVGIGTTSPTRLLDVRKDSIGDVASFRGSDGARELVITSATTTNTGDTYTLNSNSVTGEIALATNSTERMRIDSSGRLLIGGTQVQTPSSIDNGIFIQSQTNNEVVGVNLYTNEASNNRRADFFLDDANGIYGMHSTASTGLPDFVVKSATHERFRVTNAGNVGIGTSSPANTLTVGDLEASAINQDGTVGIKCNANHKGIILQENSGAEQWSIGVGEAGSLKFYDSDSTTPAVTFADISGNVGIGTTSPQKLFEVSSNSSPTVRISNTRNDTSWDTDPVFGALEFYSHDSSGSGASVRSKIQAEATTQFGNATDLVLYSGDSNGVATEGMRIEHTGKVGIGTTSPDSILEVVGADPILTIRDSETSSGATNATLRLAESAGGDTLGNYWDITHDNNAALTVTAGTSERLRIDSSGNLLVGTTSPTPYSFTTDSGICWGGGTNLPNSIARESTASCLILNKTGTQSGSSGIQDFRYDGTSVGNISISSTAVALNSTSDERLKENITDSADAGSKVDDIQIRQFDWKADGTHQDYGVIAQELLEVAPEAVHQPVDEEDMMGVDYSKLVPMLIKEVQTLRSRVAELENV